MTTLSNDGAASSSTAVLGKRKRSVSASLVLHLSGGSSSSSSEADSERPDSFIPSVADSDDECSEGGVDGHQERPLARRKGGKHAPILVNGKLVVYSGKGRRFACTFQGCAKSYKKPSRLAEHERSHTGERPYKCTSNGCSKSYLRESHLHAHARTHLSVSEKPFICSFGSCSKRYWTAQHLRRHSEVHNGEAPFKCHIDGCSTGFMKHKQLRGHVAAEHGPQELKSFSCEHDGCAKVFATSQKLRAHEKVHDDRRYTCCHPNCMQKSDGMSRPYFRTWTELQEHNRSVHPATCPYPTCAGRTFNSQKNLKAHMKIHEQREVEKEIYGVSDADDEGDFVFAKKRRGGEIGRDWKCEADGCNKEFKSKKAMRTHFSVTHLLERKFSCAHPGCSSNYGYKHLLQRHAAKAHGIHSHVQPTDVPTDNTAQPSISAIDIITGKAYADLASSRLESNSKALRCPYPDLPAVFRSQITSTHCPDPNATGCECRMLLPFKSCPYVFSRSYDLHRHLRTTHGVEASRAHVDEWVCEEKTRRLTTLP